MLKTKQNKNVGPNISEKTININMLNLSIIKMLRMALNIWFPRDNAVKKK